MKVSANRLGEVINNFDREVIKSHGSHAWSPRLVTDGQLHIRQCLFPEAERTGVKLPSYFYTVGLVI